jgi:Myb-like DNA-binding protein FlbD
MVSTQRRGPWVPEEDQDLLQLVQTQGPKNWVRISQHMRFRSPKQCRERFHQNLKPSLNHAPISADEGIVIERLVNEIGKRWAEIARRLGNRSDNSVKNWWNASMNRKKRCLALLGGANPSSRTLNGRVEPPYPKFQAPLRSPGALSHLQPSDLGARTQSWLSSADYTQRDSVRISNFTKAVVGSPVYTGQTDSFGRGQSSLFVAEDNFRAQGDWPEEKALNKSRDLERLAPSPITAHSPHTVTTPLPSPAVSESSNVTSLGPPSLISDHNSISSSSPRTAASPSMLLMPVDPLRVYDQRRRGSAPNVQCFCSTVGTCHGYSNSISGKSTESVSEMAVQRKWASHHHSSSAPQLPFAAGSKVLSPSSPRDIRMRLETLLGE